jgi:succinate dehydrogenase/fumarate reductase-like Fe-S protein
MQTANSIFVKVLRTPAAAGGTGRFQEYTVASSQPLSVMALLAEIHELDPSFACRTSTCFKGQCGSCLVRVNGRDVLGCVELVRPGEAVTIEPHSKYKVIRDVVVDFAAPREGD